MAKLNRKTKSLIVGGAVVLLLAAALVLLLLLNPGGSGADASSNASSEDTSVKLIEQKQEAVKNIHVKNKDGEYDIVLTGDKTWEIAALKGFAQNTSLYSLAASEAATVKADSVLLEKQENLEKYGLDKPVTVVTVTFQDGSSFTMNIGDAVPSSSGKYMTMAGKDPVYIYSGASYFEYSLYDYVDMTIFDIQSTKAATSSDSTAAAAAQTVDKMEISRTDLKRPIVFSKLEEQDDELSGIGFGSYQMTSPVTALMDDTNINSYVTGFLSLTASGVEALNPTAAQLQAYGLAQPSATVRVTFEGKVYTLKIGSSYTCEKTDDRDSLESGHVHTVSGYYVMREGTNIIYQASSLSLPWLSLEPESVLSSFVVLPNIADVKKVTVAFDGQTYAFEPNKKVSGEEETYSPKYNGKTLTEEYFKSYYQVLLNMTQPGLNDKNAVGSVVMSIQYEYLDSSRKTDKLEVFDNGAGAYILSLNGAPSFVTRVSYVNKIKEATALIIENKKIDPN